MSLFEASSERKLAVPKDAVRCCKLQPRSGCKRMTLDSRRSVSTKRGPVPLGRMGMVLRICISAGTAKATVKAIPSSLVALPIPSCNQRLLMNQAAW